MGMRRKVGAASRTDDAASPGKAGRWRRRLLVGVVVAAVLGNVAVGGRFVNSQTADAADANAVVMERFLSESSMQLVSRQQEFTVVLTNGVLAQGECGAAYELARTETSPEQEKRLEEWREEGIRMAAELTGIPEAFFRWLADQGLPVGEFMRFLAPFLEWLELVEPHNGTRGQPPQKRQAPTTI